MQEKASNRLDTLNMDRLLPALFLRKSVRRKTREACPHKKRIGKGGRSETERIAGFAELLQRPGERFHCKRSLYLARFVRRSLLPPSLVTQIHVRTGPRNSRIIETSRSLSLNWQLQITRTLQPVLRKAFWFSRSLSAFRDSFRVQNSSLVFGIWYPAGHSCRCQKQP